MVHFSAATSRFTSSQEPQARPMRQVNWEIQSGLVTYSCTACKWQFTMKLGECSEPMRMFAAHKCDDHLIDH